MAVCHWNPLNAPTCTLRYKHLNGPRPNMLETTRAVASVADAIVVHCSPEVRVLSTTEEIYLFLRAVLARDSSAIIDWNRVPKIFHVVSNQLLEWCELESNRFMIHATLYERLHGHELTDLMKLEYLHTNDGTVSFKVLGLFPEDARLLYRILIATLGNNKSKKWKPKLNADHKEIDGGHVSTRIRWNIYADEDRLCFSTHVSLIGEVQLLMVPKLIHNGGLADKAAQFYPSYAQIFSASVNERNLPLRKHGMTCLMRWLGIEISCNNIRECVNPHRFACMFDRLCNGSVVQTIALRRKNLADGLCAYLANVTWFRFFSRSAMPHLTVLIDKLIISKIHHDLASALSRVFNLLARGTQIVPLPGTLITLNQLFAVIENPELDPTTLCGLFFAMKAAPSLDKSVKQCNKRKIPLEYPMPEAHDETIAWKKRVDTEFGELDLKYGKIWSDFGSLLKVCYYAEQLYSGKERIIQKPLLEPRHILCSNDVHHAIPMATEARDRAYYIPGPKISNKSESDLPPFARTFPILLVNPIVDARRLSCSPVLDSECWIYAERDYRLT